MEPSTVTFTIRYCVRNSNDVKQIYYLADICNIVYIKYFPKHDPNLHPLQTKVIKNIFTHKKLLF